MLFDCLGLRKQESPRVIVNFVGLSQFRGIISIDICEITLGRFVIRNPPQGASMPIARPNPTTIIPKALWVLLGVGLWIG